MGTFQKHFVQTKSIYSMSLIFCQTNSTCRNAVPPPTSYFQSVVPCINTALQKCTSPEFKVKGIEISHQNILKVLKVNVCITQSIPLEGFKMYKSSKIAHLQDHGASHFNTL